MSSSTGLRASRTVSRSCSNSRRPLRAATVERPDGTTVHGDASGEWTLDEDGEADDIVFFVSPGWVRDLEQRGLLTHKPSDEEGAPAD